MALPGKLCVGILEEDNPLKAYFRFKPLLVEEGGAFVPWTEGDVYPDDGCIRIVPDKNESYHFKARMRKLGLFCVVDLRAHPEDNDKIRPNKNFKEDGEERNAFIIYSDVVRECAPESILALVTGEGAGELQGPTATPGVLLTDAEGAPGSEIYVWAAEGEEEQGRLSASGRECPVEEMQIFELGLFGEDTLRFAVAAPEKVLAVPAEKPEKPEKPEPEPAAPQAEKPGESEKAEAAEPRKKPRAEKAPQEPDKPWIHRDSSILPKPVDPRLPPAQRIMAEQAGLNPRRGRSLQELIDEKWQHSRMNQLGHPVAALATGMPLVSPVDAAVGAVRSVWEQPALRGSLLSSLAGIEDFGEALETCREAARNSAVSHQLDALEARRLELLDELDKLRRNNAELRDRLKQEIRRDEEEAFSEAAAQTAAARAEQRAWEAKAQAARAFAEDAKKALDALTGEALEKRVRELMLDKRILNSLDAARRGPKCAPQPEVEWVEASLEQIIERVEARFEAEGWLIERRDAANLAVCAALCPALILSGPVGSGKTGAARLLADALGWAAAGRFASLSGEPRPFPGAPLKGAEIPAMLLADDANLGKGFALQSGIDLVRERPEWRLFATVQDSHTGQPVPAHALDMGFMIRLGSEAGEDWRPRRRAPWASPAPVSLCAAVESLLPQPEEAVPAACSEGLDALRKVLAGHGAAPSRRAMADAWNYCGIMAACLGPEADAGWILDMAVSQRVLPVVLATAPIEALRALPQALVTLPHSRALLSQPLPISV